MGGRRWKEREGGERGVISLLAYFSFLKEYLPVIVWIPRVTGVLCRFRFG